MRNCTTCGKEIPSSIIIDNRRINLSKRKTCLACNPFKSGNQKRGVARTWTDEQLKEAVRKSASYSEVLRHLSLRPYGSSFKFIKHHINRLALNVDHFYNTKPTTSWIAKSFDEVFCENSKVARATVVKHLQRHKYIEYKCSLCNCNLYEKRNEIWYFNTKPLILTVEHKNGVGNDNRLENLCWLCPNCHSQTDTFAGRKNDTAMLTNKRLATEYKLHIPGPPLSEKSCPHCGTTFKPINAKIKFCSEICAHQATAKAKYKISKEELINLLQIYPASKIGELYNVSGNAVKKWCKSYGITPPMRGYWQKQYAIKAKAA